MLKQGEKIEDIHEGNFLLKERWETWVAGGWRKEKKGKKGKKIEDGAAIGPSTAIWQEEAIFFLSQVNSEVSN